jgi:hypothetical protein
MSINICYWKKGNVSIYTKKLDVINKAIKDGYLVSIIKEKPYIYNGDLY